LAEADAEYATYLGRNPRSVAAHDGAGEVALLRGDLSSATRHFNEALAIGPKDPVALRQLGLIEIRNGRYIQARDLFAKAVEVAPDDIEIRYNYALALKLAGDDARAAEETLVTDRLRAEQQRIADLRVALRQNPDDDDSRAEVAKWLIEHGHEEEGLEWTELILRKKPGHPANCQLLADYHAKKGNFGLANYYRLGASPSYEKPPR
jgi:type IV pilus assembly protein PilF